LQVLAQILTKGQNAYLTRYERVYAQPSFQTFCILLQPRNSN
jgi:hypothetical protein